MSNMYYVYVLRSERDEKLYIGSTNNVVRRLEEHNCGKLLVTRHRKPFKIIYTETFQTRAEAMRREKYFKSLKGGNGFKKIIFTGE